MLRFAILKTVSTNQEEVILEYQEGQLNSRLRRRVRESLLSKNKFFKRFTSEEIDKAIDSSFNDLVAEFKEETVRLV